MHWKKKNKEILCNHIYDYYNVQIFFKLNVTQIFENIYFSAPYQKKNKEGGGGVVSFF